MQEGNTINPIMIYGILGVAGLGLAYLFYRKVSSDVSNIFGGKDREEETKKLKKEVKKLKIDWSKKISLGKSKEAAISKAKAYAALLYNNLKGYTDEDEQALIMVIFKKLKYKTDVRLVFKAFGVKEGQDLSGWIITESMTPRRKNYILGKIGASV